MPDRLQLVPAQQYSEVRALLLGLYREIYVDEDTGFHDADRFADRADAYARHPGWAAVIGRGGDGEATGYAFGAPLPPGSRWWRSARRPLPAAYTEETGGRTFAVFELMVRRPWRGTGEAARIHESLLKDRPEERATLLVDAAHDAVRRRYEEWGYLRIGDQQPFEDSPVYSMMVRDLNK
ncbi:N-acetyltransferase (plasmid) [Streptomyces sp. NBC_01525]|uniref:N-acetyltransferase n=1 Tax=Streptomyces sp. NBC_01525 TaxID=2903893 RepID=UPI002F910A39